MNCFAQSHIHIDPKDWSDKRQRFNPNVDWKVRQKYEERINKLKRIIVDRYNDAFYKGEVIDSKWLKGIVNEFYGINDETQKDSKEDDKPKFNKDEYFIAYWKHFLLNFENYINFKTGKPLSYRTKQKYMTTMKLVEEFQKWTEYKKNFKGPLKHTDITLQFHKLFDRFMAQYMSYTPTTRGKHFGLIKAVCRRIDDEDIEISRDYTKRAFYKPLDEAIDTYLNFDEIDLIFNLDLDDEQLENSRRWFIIGLWTGQRVGDLFSLKTENVTHDSILIPNSRKTGATIKIPIHKQVKAVLELNEGYLPYEISQVQFNADIKEICRLAGITQPTLGKLMNPDTRRKEKGIFPKYKLIASHTCRRSFATNHHRLLGEDVVMAITGHKNVDTYRKYIKTTDEEKIDEVRKLWEG